ncbi:MAG: PD40 domain-containing protein [Chloroflexi bacterium]|nr:PD40 domain-containing protein [Chloroflexota bacterium]
MMHKLIYLVAAGLLLALLVPGCAPGPDDGPFLPGPRELRQLVREVYGIGSLSISADGKKMLTVSTAKPGSDQMSVSVRNAFTGTPLQLYQFDPIVSASWGPDSSSLAYLALDPGIEKRSVGILPEDALGMNNIVDFMGYDYVSTPAWSPDGRFIAFWSRKVPGEGNTEYALWMTRPDGSDLKTLYGGVGAMTIGAFAGDVRWSPYNDKLLFNMSRGDAASAFVVERRGGNPKNLTPDYLKVSDLLWSPSGKKIAYAAIERERLGGPPRIGVMDADGSGKTILGPNGWPVGWIPNSGELAYISFDGSVKIARASHRLEAVNPKTRAVRVLAEEKEDTIVAAATSSSSRAYFVTADEQGYGKIMVVE